MDLNSSALFVILSSFASIHRIVLQILQRLFAVALRILSTAMVNFDKMYLLPPVRISASVFNMMNGQHERGEMSEIC